MKELSTASELYVKSCGTKGKKTDAYCTNWSACWVTTTGASGYPETRGDLTRTFSRHDNTDHTKHYFQHLHGIQHIAN